MSQNAWVLLWLIVPLVLFWLAVMVGTLASCILSGRITRREEGSAASGNALPKSTI